MKIHINNLDKLTEVDKMYLIKQDGWLIRFLTSPSEALQLAAISQDKNIIFDIDEPTEAVQIEVGCF